MHDYEHYVNVYGYEFKCKYITIVNVAITEEIPQTWEVSVLHINQALLNTSMKKILQCPFRHNDVIVNDLSKFLLKNPMANDHSVLVT